MENGDHRSSFKAVSSTKSAKPFVVLLHRHRPLWIAVNDSACEIALMLDKGNSPQCVVDYLVATRGAVRTEALRDLESVRRSLSGTGFLCDDSLEPRSPCVESVFLHLCNACNLMCQHCYALPPDVQEIYLPTPVVLSVLSELERLRAKRVTLSGGEPLLHPDLRRIVEFAGPRFKIQLLTNGTLIDEEWARFLAQFDIDIQISLDGSTSSVHDAIRGQGSYDAAIRGLKHLQEAGLGRSITIATTVMNHNVGDLANMVSLAAELDVPRLRFLPLRRTGMAARQWEHIGSRVSGADYERVFQIVERYEPAGRNPQDVTSGLSGMGLEMPEHGRSDGEGFWCPVGKQVVVSPEGDAYPCVLLMAGEFKLGNVARDTLHSMTQSETMTRVCRSLAERPYKIPECARCTWRSLCQGGCTGRALDVNGTIWNADDQCEYRKKAYQRAFDRILDLHGRSQTEDNPNHET